MTEVLVACIGAEGLILAALIPVLLSARKHSKRAADEVSNDHNTNLRDDLDKLTTLVRTTDRRNGRRVAQVNRRVDKLVDRLDLVEDTIDPRTLRRRTK